MCDILKMLVFVAAKIISHKIGVRMYFEYRIYTSLIFMCSLSIDSGPRKTT